MNTRRTIKEKSNALSSRRHLLRFWMPAMLRKKDWYPLTHERGVAAKNDPPVAYRASKVCAQGVAWDFIQKEKPKLSIATICELRIFGSRADAFKSIECTNTFNGVIWSLLMSGKGAPMPEPRVLLAVDVRDVTYIHVAASERLVDTNQHFLIAVGS